MSESGFLTFNHIYGFGVSLTYAVLLTAFFHPFISAQSRKWHRPLIVFSVYILFEMVCNRASLPQGSFGLILSLMLLAAAKWVGLEKYMVFLLMILYFGSAEKPLRHNKKSWKYK